MENNFLIFTDHKESITLERFHICTWEFSNDSSLVEFGAEISKETIGTENELRINFFIPWVDKKCERKDLYNNLLDPENSRFIFNDSITKTLYLEGYTSKLGVIHKFSGKKELCILPSKIEIEDKIISVTLNLKPYQEYTEEEEPNIYFRFSIKPSIPYISIRKNGIGKSTIIYDVKVNEKRNIPRNKIEYFSDNKLCKIDNCFLFNIVPNKYDLVFFDNSSLKNVRTLEYESFNKYLGDKRVKKDELIVVFNKKKDEKSYSFFSIYSMERIGMGQFALAILINIICGILLSFPSYRKEFNSELSFYDNLKALPEICIAIVIVFFTFIYFVFPIIKGRIINPLLKKIGL